MKTITIDGVEYGLIPVDEYGTISKEELINKLREVTKPQPLIKRYDVSKVRGFGVRDDGSVFSCDDGGIYRSNEEWATKEAAERAAALIELQKQCIANGGEVCVSKRGCKVIAGTYEATSLIVPKTFSDILFDSKEKAEAFAKEFEDLILKAQPK